MKLKDKLDGFRLDWLANEVIMPNKQKGMNINTFYSFVYKDISESPNWLLLELKRITHRNITK